MEHKCEKCPTGPECRLPWPYNPDYADYDRFPYWEFRLDCPWFMIDGHYIPSPDINAEVSVSDLDAQDSGRDESGVMHRIVVRKRVHTWKFSYKILPMEVYRRLRNMLSGGKDGTFEFSGYDATGEQHTCKAYCSQESAVIPGPHALMCRDLKFTIIEC